MKKTLNINLAGYPFTIDDDAYQLLKDYLDTIRYAFDTKADTGEIAADIESRIAELLIEHEYGGVRIVSFEEISNVIERIGKPSEFIEVEESFSYINENEEEIKTEERRTTPPPYEPYRNYGNVAKKKLFRDPQNAMLGGVCSGLAFYLNIDVTIVRLLTVVLFFLSATTVAIAYIILWIVVPEATTPYDRMQMMGENPTVENIGKTVTENFQNEENEKQENRFSGFRNFLSSAFSIFVKCFVILGFIIGFPILLALLLVLLACIIAFFAAGGALIGGGIFGEELPFSAPGGGVLALYLLLATIGAIITLGIPFWLLIRMVWKKGNNNISTTNRRSLLILWLVGLALTAVFTVKSVKKAKYLNNQDWGVNIEKLEEPNYLNEKDIEDIEDIENIEDISITKEGVILDTKEGKKIKVTKGKVSILTEENTSVSQDSLASSTSEVIEEVIETSKFKTDSIN